MYDEPWEKMMDTTASEMKMIERLNENKGYDFNGFDMLPTLPSVRSETITKGEYEKRRALKKDGLLDDYLKLKDLRK